MNSFQFRQNSTIYTDLAVIQTIQWSFKPFVSHLFAEDPGLSISSAVAILPDFDGFLPILSKLNYLDRCSRHPATKMPKLTLCLPPARWGPRTLDSRCSGNVASFRWISSNFIKKTWLSIQSSDPLNAKINPLSPTCSLRTQAPRFPV